MKKIILSIIIAISFSCGGRAVSPVGSNACQRELDVYTAAVTAWTNDLKSIPKCEAVKSSLDKIVKNCSLLTATERKRYQDDLTSFKCN